MMKFSSIFLLALASLASGHEDCKDTTEIISNLHGIVQLPSREMTITVCNASILANHNPINLATYQDYLKFKKNNRLFLTLAADTFSLLPNLKTLIASNIDLTAVDVNAFKNLGNLQYLNLENNQIAALPTNIFDNTPNLIELNLENNKIQVINEHQFDKLTNLKKLRLAKNRISGLEGQWYNGLQNLEYLSLSNNQLTTIRAGMFQGLPKLETLRLEYNQINKIELDAFSGLSSLSSLSLQYNQNIAPENLLDELKKIQNLRGLAISPPGLKCDVLTQVIEWSNERGVDLIQIPAERRCW